jgi:intracellular septation protein
MKDPSPREESASSTFLGGELLPLLVFLVVYKLSGMLVATAAIMAVLAGKIGWRLFRGKVVEPMLWVTGAIVLILGGATLAFRDESFIKWKPTAIYWCGALALAGFQLFLKKNLLESAMSSKVSLPGPVWRKVLVSWVVFLLGLGALNLYVASNYSSDVWVNFKVFGTLGIFVVFVAAQSFWLRRYLVEPSEEQG